MGANEGKKEEKKPEEEDEEDDYGDDDADSLDYNRKPEKKEAAAKKEEKVTSAPQKGKPPEKETKPVPAEKKADKKPPEEPKKKSPPQEPAKKKQPVIAKKEAKKPSEPSLPPSSPASKSKSGTKKTDSAAQNRPPASIKKEEKKNDIIIPGEKEQQQLDSKKQELLDSENSFNNSQILAPVETACPDDTAGGDKSGILGESPGNANPSDSENEKLEEGPETPPEERRQEIIHNIKQFSKWRVQYETLRALKQRRNGSPENGKKLAILPALRRRVSGDRSSSSGRSAVQRGFLPRDPPSGTAEINLKEILQKRMNKPQGVNNSHVMRLEEKKALLKDYDTKFAANLISRAADPLGWQQKRRETCDNSGTKSPSPHQLPPVVDLAAEKAKIKHRLEATRALRGYVLGTEECSRNPYAFVQTVLKSAASPEKSPVLVNLQQQRNEFSASPYAPMVLQSILNHRDKLAGKSKAQGWLNTRQKQKERSFSSIFAPEEKFGMENIQRAKKYSLKLPPMSPLKR